MTDLKARLESAADDTGRALSTDLGDLLDRARRARRRDRLRTTVVAMSAVAVVAVAAPLALGRLTAGPAPTPLPAGTVSPEPSPSSEAPTSAADAILDEDEIVARCAPQLEKYTALPRWRGGSANPVIPPLPADAWFVVNQDRTSYRAGDVVSIGEPRDNGPARLCLIPQPGHEDDPVPFDALVPSAADQDLITQVCSEAEAGRRGTPDVRDADVLVAHRAGDVLVAALSRGEDFFACTVPAPSLSDRVGFETRGPLRPSRGTTFGVNVAVVGPKASPTSAYYWANGFLPRDVATISFQVQGRAAVEFPVRDGAFALAVQEPLTGVARSRYTLLDAQGRVLHTSPWT